LHVPQPSKEIQKLLASFEPAHSLSRRQAASLQKSCPECGMTYGEFRQLGRFGCANDYEVFGEDVVALLERIHGSSRYSGKLPGGEGMAVGDMQAEIADARKRLQQAIETEDYELAAKLRDEIRRLTETALEGG
jgi:protein arginine kinase activator